MVSFDVSLNFANASNKVTHRERNAGAMLVKLCLSHALGACLDPLTHCLCLRLQVPYRISQAWLLQWLSPCPVASHQSSPSSPDPWDRWLACMDYLMSLDYPKPNKQMTHTHIPSSPHILQVGHAPRPFILAQVKHPWERKGLVHNSHSRNWF